jgi:5-methylcytosine-specific restriction endonuclease McrA
VLAYNERWEAEHYKERQGYKKQYREAHKGEIATYKRQYREDNAETIAEEKRRYDLANPEKRLQRGHKRRSKERGAGGTYTEADLSDLYELQQGKCCWCRKQLVNRLIDRTATRNNMFTIDHVRPIHRQGTNWAWNLVLVCRRCNSSRRDRLVLLEWQPPAMLNWMADYMVRAMLLEFFWQVLQWKIKISFRFV